MGTSPSPPAAEAARLSAGNPRAFDIRKIAIIGAGPSGLAAAKHLLAVGAFAQVDVFEQQAEVGGVWNYSARPSGAPLPIPQTGDARCCPPDPPVAAEPSSGSAPPLFPSPMYDDLHTNIPHTLMRFSDLAFPEGCEIFPPRRTVQEYLVRYARDVRHLIRFSTQVTDVSPHASSSCSSADGSGSGISPDQDWDQEERWDVRTTDLLTGATSKATYDAVVVASGHYATPYVPDVPGLRAFAAAAPPGAVAHSKTYRRPEPYAGKKVLVIGNSASGLDIAAQIARAGARHPVLVSARSPAAPETLAHLGPGCDEVPEVARFFADGRGVRFRKRQGDGDGKGRDKDPGANGLEEKPEEDAEEGEEGRVETDIDCVLFCTGYLYMFPFLRSLMMGDGEGGSRPRRQQGEQPLVTDGRRVHGLARHLLHAAHPTLAFPGLPIKVIPFPLAEAQMTVVARLWSNRLPRPPRAELERWGREDEERWLSGEGARGNERSKNRQKGFHVFPKGGDGRYINEMHDWAMRAVGPGRGRGEGPGKEPPYWGEVEWWQRGVYAEAKMRFEETGKNATSLEELGFRFEPSANVRPDAGGLKGDSADLDIAG
ncbi:hypothetical protein DL762_008783 [Monosporascus cannonballus]|uniref:FAD/NAD(P)-binding domain-containing protein n=1 Tax=Monosporascus cannonballus TaxID=155416 RepID=A0ABY0GVI1_9PEZI|nr:hypothetical protein DL762_008783 [Monosporascus cannonballus]